MEMAAVDRDPNSNYNGSYSAFSLSQTVLHLLDQTLQEPCVDRRVQSLRRVRQILSSSSRSTLTDKNKKSQADCCYCECHHQPQNQQVEQLEHQKLLELGCDVKLSWQLCWELQQQNPSQGPLVEAAAAEAVGLLCECLCCLWEGIPKRKRHLALTPLLFPSSSTSSYLPWYLYAWKRFPFYDGVARNVAWMIQLWSQCRDADFKSRCIRFLFSSSSELESDSVLVLEQIFRAILTSSSSASPYNTLYSYSELELDDLPAVRLLSAIKDLSFRARESDNRLLHSKLYNVVVRCYFNFLNKNKGEETRNNNSHSCSNKRGNMVVVETILSILWNWASVSSLALRMSNDSDTWLLLRTVVCSSSEVMILIIPQTSNSSSYAEGPPSSYSTTSLSIHRQASSIVGCMIAASCTSSSQDDDADDAYSCSINKTKKMNTVSSVAANTSSSTVTTDALMEDNSGSNIPTQTRNKRVLLMCEQEWLLPHVAALLNQHPNATEKEGIIVNDPDLRRRYLRVVRCLASCEWGRRFLFQQEQQKQQQQEQQQQGFSWLAILVQVVRNVHGDSTDARCLACQSLTLLIPWGAASSSSQSNPHIHSKHINIQNQWIALAPCLEAILLQTIQDDAQHTPDKLLLLACEALSVSLVYHGKFWTRGPTHNIILSSPPSGSGSSLLERLLSALQEHVSDPNYHVTISQLILQAVKDERGGTPSSSLSSSSVPQSSSQELSSASSALLLLANRDLLDLVAHLLTPVGPEFETSRDNGLEIIATLLERSSGAGTTSDGDGKEQEGGRSGNGSPAGIHTGKKRILADNNDRLLTALVNYCILQGTTTTSTTTAKKKDLAKRVILELVPEL